jgi:hypothetical protein
VEQEEPEAEHDHERHVRCPGDVQSATSEPYTGYCASGCHHHRSFGEPQNHWQKGGVQKPTDAEPTDHEASLT